MRLTLHLQLFNSVIFTWRARLSNNLGQFNSRLNQIPYVAQQQQVIEKAHGIYALQSLVPPIRL